MAGRRRGRIGGGVEVLDSIYSVVALVFILVACVELGDAATAVDVYRLIQYDIAGVPYGSRLAGLNHHAGASFFAPGADLSRTVVMMPVRELNLTFLREYIISNQPLGGLLLLLPEKVGNRIVGKIKSKDDGLMRNILVELEQLLIHANIPYPVYFAFEDDKINAVLADVRRNDATGQPPMATTGGYKLLVSIPEPKRVSSPTITNIQGWLPGLKGDGDTNQLPTIAVVASYDTFGAAPALSVGSDSNGSGVVALLEIARLFSRLYSNPKTRGRYNLLFGLTSGGPYNYDGTLKSLSDVANELGVTIGIKHKKINISNPRVAWEHEQFSRLRITAVTLSELSAAPELLESTGGLHDTRDSLDEAAVYRTIRLVAESLAKHIYGHQGRNIQIFADNSSLAINPFYISAWLDLLSRAPRVAPFLSKTDPIISSLKKELSDHTVELHVQHETIDGMFSFYDSTRATLNVYQVASVAFDLLLLLALGAYLILLFSFLVLTTRGLDDLINLFRRPPSRKVKAA
ncbi:uncharacterized protein [Elaeis guineensis]|uniref:uncharacterized protein isoform X2 n=1 Tax=Elaeis guineensis var. tenera TaxID=51953 RepID=UPI00057B5912